MRPRKCLSEKSSPILTSASLAVSMALALLEPTASSLPST
jgi:hypothetical protein